MKLPILSRLDRVPPFAYRLLSKIRISGTYRAMTLSEIAARSGLHETTIERVSMKKTWGGITINTADKFIHGCGFDPFKQSRAIEMLRRISQSKRGIGGVRHLLIHK